MRCNGDSGDITVGVSVILTGYWFGLKLLQNLPSVIMSKEAFLITTCQGVFLIITVREGAFIPHMCYWNGEEQCEAYLPSSRHIQHVKLLPGNSFCHCFTGSMSLFTPTTFLRQVIP